MKSHISCVKVRYAETDQMGIVYHGNYAQYLEIARIEWLAGLGVSYKKMEVEGIMLPVYELKLKFIKPARFDEILKIETTLVKKPGVRIEFTYKIHNEEGDLLTEAETVLVFLDAKRRKPVRCPDYILELLKGEDEFRK